MKNEIIIMKEPTLAFRYGQEVSDPRDGLSLFGPVSADSPAHPAAVSYALVGTPRGAELFSAWSKMMLRAWTNAPNDQHHLWPPFPGFEAAFASDWHPRPAWKHILDPDDLNDAAHRHDHHERVYTVVNQYIAAFEDLQKIDEHIGVLVCVVPDEIYNTCRIESHLAASLKTGDAVTRKQIHSRKQGQLEMFSTYDPEQYALSLDFQWCEQFLRYAGAVAPAGRIGAGKAGLWVAATNPSRIRPGFRWAWARFGPDPGGPAGPRGISAGSGPARPPPKAFAAPFPGSF